MDFFPGVTILLKLHKPLLFICKFRLKILIFFHILMTFKQGVIPAVGKNLLIHHVLKYLILKYA